jgi:hypothetical protein
MQHKEFNRGENNEMEKAIAIIKTISTWKDN